jgi:hypothetical protein
VLNVAQPSKKEPPPIIGLLMANSIVYPAEIQSTANSSQRQPMKPFTWASAIPSPAKKLKISFIQPGSPGFFINND